MRVSRWVWLFTALTLIQAAQILLHLTVLPYAGTLATAALLGFAASREGASGLARRAGLGGLAALTLAAGVVDNRHGGSGWPQEFGERSGRPAALLVLLAGALFAVTVLARTGRGLRRLHFLPAAAGTLLAVVLLARFASSREPGRIGPLPYPIVTVLVLLLPVVAVVLLFFAANAALASGRRWRPAGWALLPVLVLAVGAVDAVASLGVLTTPPTWSKCRAAAR